MKEKDIPTCIFCGKSMKVKEQVPNQECTLYYCECKECKEAGLERFTIMDFNK